MIWLRKTYFRLTGRCPYCFTGGVSEPDIEGLHDCFNCGVSFFTVRDRRRVAS